MNLYPQVPKHIWSWQDYIENLQKAAKQWWLDNVQEYKEEYFQKDPSEPNL